MSASARDVIYQVIKRLRGSTLHVGKAIGHNATQSSKKYVAHNSATLRGARIRLILQPRVNSKSEQVNMENNYNNSVGGKKIAAIED